MTRQAAVRTDIRAVILATFDEHRIVLDATVGQLPDAVEAAARLLVQAYLSGGKAILFGNGGSMSDALHIEGELVNRFAVDRPGVAAVALGGAASLTATANDYSYDEVFARMFVAHHRPGDLALGFSTSGNSRNVVAALRQARALAAATIAFTGAGGGRCAEVADVLLAVPSRSTPRIQEMHITIGHVLCDLVEQAIVGRA
jgi:D-sedoheptulose 7-phosphate isomerase